MVSRQQPAQRWWPRLDRVLSPGRHRHPGPRLPVSTEPLAPAIRLVLRAHA